MSHQIELPPPTCTPTVQQDFRAQVLLFRPADQFMRLHYPTYTLLPTAFSFTHYPRLHLLFRWTPPALPYTCPTCPAPLPEGPHLAHARATCALARAHAACRRAATFAPPPWCRAVDEDVRSCRPAGRTCRPCRSRLYAPYYPCPPACPCRAGSVLFVLPFMVIIMSHRSRRA